MRSRRVWTAAPPSRSCRAWVTSPTCVRYTPPPTLTPQPIQTLKEHSSPCNNTSASSIFPIQHVIHLMKYTYHRIASFMQATVLMALLQPAPEVFNLFDDVLLLAEGHIIYHGPKEDVRISLWSHQWRCLLKGSLRLLNSSCTFCSAHIGDCLLRSLVHEI